MDAYDLGLRLKQSREARNLSQAEAARRISLTRSAISSYENNTSAPSLEVLKDLARLYNVQTDYLLGLSDRLHIYIDSGKQYEADAILRVVGVIQEGFIKQEAENNESN